MRGTHELLLDELDRVLELDEREELDESEELDDRALLEDERLLELDTALRDELLEDELPTGSSAAPLALLPQLVVGTAGTVVSSAILIAIAVSTGPM
jgi:hypothetical protein